jgi:hypothetical protein
LDKTRSQCFTSREARHLAIAEGRIKVRPLQMYHGEWDMACRSEMSVKKGPVTLLSVVQTANKLRLLIAEAESVPGPILEIGNTNSRYRFPVGARRFIEGSGMRRVQHINARWGRSHSDEIEETRVTTPYGLRVDLLTAISTENLILELIRQGRC